MKDKEIEALIEKKISAEINKFKNDMDKIFEDKAKTWDSKMQEIHELVKDYTQQKNNSEAREHKEENPERFTGSRNRVIIQAELKQHMMQFQENWQHNTDHADGKYTNTKNEEWDKKRIRLEEELKNSPA